MFVINTRSTSVMSINTEFDFWPEERLAALVSCLAKSREGKPLQQKADERDLLPSAPAALPPSGSGPLIASSERTMA